MKVSFEDFPNWLSLEVDKLVKPTKTKGRKLVDESIRSLDEGKGFFGDLSRKGERDMASKKDPVSYKAARLVGHSAGEAYQTLTKVQPPTEISWEGLKAYKDQLSSLTKSLREIRAKTVAQLSGFYLLDMRSFGGVNDRILKHSERLTHFLEGDGSTLQKARTLTSSLAEAEAVRREIDESVLEAGGLEREKESLAQASVKLAEELAQIENDPLVKELLSTERSLRNESRRFKTEKLAHLKRPLRRLRDLSERGEVPLSSDARDALKRYIDSPYRSFLSSKTGPYLPGILDNLRTATSSGKLGFKPKKSSRVLSQLDQLSLGDELALRQSEGRKLLSRRKSLFGDTNCRSLYESRKQTIEQTDRVKMRIRETEEKMRISRSKASSLDARLRELLASLQEKTKQLTGLDVQLQRPITVPAPP